MLLDPSCPPVESTGAYCRKRDVDTKRQVDDLVDGRRRLIT